jgi:hypothetical protein
MCCAVQRTMGLIIKILLRRCKIEEIVLSLEMVMVMVVQWLVLYVVKRHTRCTSVKHLIQIHSYF